MTRHTYYFSDITIIKLTINLSNDTTYQKRELK